MAYKTITLNRKITGFGKLELEVKIHPTTTGKLIVNMPEITGDIDGYKNKYGKLADMLQKRNIGAVVRMVNHYIEGLPYPNSMVNNFSFILDHSLRNAREICGSDKPEVFLMGFSAGASTIASVAGDYDEVKKILLMAPSGDAGQANIERGLKKFRGGVYIVVGENDEVVGKETGKTFYDMALGACSKDYHIIPSCDHQFRGETNGRIMSKAPVWAFVGDKTFPSPNGGIKLY